MVRALNLVHEHWQLWATMMRDADPVGWYRRQPWYTPPRRGNEAGGPPVLYAEEDFRAAELIARAVARLMVRDNELRQVLVQYYGAYPHAPPDRGERMSAFSKSRQDLSRLRKRAENWVAGYIDALEDVRSDA